VKALKYIEFRTHNVKLMDHIGLHVMMSLDILRRDCPTDGSDDFGTAYYAPAPTEVSIYYFIDSKFDFRGIILVGFIVLQLVTSQSPHLPRLT
jgi:hypothetical protein